MHSPTDTLSHERLSSAEFSTDVILPVKYLRETISEGIQDRTPAIKLTVIL